MDNNKEERLPVGVLTMLLAGYRETIKRLTFALVVSIICYICIGGGFLSFLAGFEVQVENYGGFENSKVNTANGQFNDKVDNFTVNNNGVDLNGTGKK